MGLQRNELVARVERLLAGDWETDEEMELLFEEIEKSVPCPFPQVQEIIFHTDDLSPEEKVEKMLAYKAIRL
jgi:hypothetical protein